MPPTSWNTREFHVDQIPHQRAVNCPSGCDGCTPCSCAKLAFAGTLSSPQFLSIAVSRSEDVSYSWHVGMTN